MSVTILRSDAALYERTEVESLLTLPTAVGEQVPSEQVLTARGIERFGSSKNLLNGSSTSPAEVSTGKETTVSELVASSALTASKKRDRDLPPQSGALALQKAGLKKVGRARNPSLLQQGQPKLVSQATLGA